MFQTVLGPSNTVLLLSVNPHLKLVEMRGIISNELKMDESSIDLSMGMSTDYLQAITQGATTVRVGSKIFGSRTYPTST